MSDATPNAMTATWSGGLRFVHRSASGHAVVSDAPAAVGGDDTAATPMELVLLGLLGCTGVDVMTILTKMKQVPTAFEVAANYERAEDHPRVFTRIHLTYAFRGELDARKVERAVKLSETTYCSVSAMLVSTAEITHEIIIKP